MQKITFNYIPFFYKNLHTDFVVEKNLSKSLSIDLFSLQLHYIVLSIGLRVDCQTRKNTSKRQRSGK